MTVKKKFNRLKGLFTKSNRNLSENRKEIINKNVDK